MITATTSIAVSSINAKDPTVQDKIWITKDGRMIPVRQMDLDHVHRAIAMIRRRGNWRRDYLARLMLELQIRDLK